MPTLQMCFSGSFRPRRRSSPRVVICALIAVGLALITPSRAGETAPPGSAIHKVQVSDAAVGARLAGQGAVLVADYGSYALYQTGEPVAGLAGAPGIQLRDDYNFILLNAAKLDTSKAETQALRKSVGVFTGKRLHLVQFAGPVQPAWREELLQAGIQIVCYIPRNAYLVYGDEQAIAAVQVLGGKSPHIQWEGTYLPKYKIHPAARAVDDQGNPKPIGTSQFTIQMFADPEANAVTLNLIDQLKLEAIADQHNVLEYLNVVVSLPPAIVGVIAEQPEVVSIQPYFLPQKLCERQAQILAGNLSGNVPAGPGYLAWLESKGFTQAQFDASGFAVDLTDSGIDNGTTMPNHPGLFVQGVTNGPSRVIYNRLEGTPNNPGSTLAGCDGHGTVNAHIIAGYDDQSGFPHTDTAGYHYGLGICPFVRLGSSVIFDADFFTFPNFTHIQSGAYKDGARLSSNSWGGGAALGSYSASSQEYDMLVRDAQPVTSPYPTNGNQEMVIIFAAGNQGQGRQTVIPPGTGKNVIAVGAAENVQAFGGPDGSGIDDSGANSANDIIFFSSRGPCSDGRHKPDIMSPGTHVSGGVAQAPDPGPLGMADPCFLADASGVSGGPIFSSFWPFWPGGQEFFTACSGTSQATPGAAGSAALLRQWFINQFRVPASPAMTKGYLMNTARYMTGAGANDTLWSDNQGMGEVNLGMAFDDTRRILRDQSPIDLFTASGQVRTFTGSINNPGRPVRVTLAWTDAPGTTAGAAYNNNLDLAVTVGGVTYLGNVFTGQYSAPGGSSDAFNNVESVFLPAGLSGSFTVTVTATDINSDGVPNNDTPLDQDFALIIYNATPPPPQINSFLPTNLFVLVGQPALFTVNATSFDVISYQWRKNGNNIPGATTNTYLIPVAQLTNSGTYSVIVSDINGSTPSPDATLTVVPTVPLPFALNNSNFVWSTGTNYPWFGQTNFSHDGVASGQSYFVTAGQQCFLQTSTNGPGTLNFWWKVSSETNAGLCTFSHYGNGYTNGAQITGPLGTNDTLWTNQTFYLPVGLQTLQWTYATSSGTANRTNGAYIDQVSFVPGATLPFIITQPADQGIFGATPVTFSVNASGTPRLTYEWRYNGVPITGATNSSYTIASAGAVDAGLYSVRVGNAFGSVDSSAATLQVVPLVLSGDNSDGQTSATLAATNAIGIAAGAFHTLIVRSDGTVLGWGNNAAGQCTPPITLTNAAAVAAGSLHSLALKLDGTVVGWGDNSSGQATPPTALSSVTALAAGTRHSVALRTDGTVAAWGDNSLGQLNVPAGLSTVVAIAAGGDHSVALRADGTVVGWGANTDPQFNFSGQSLVPWGLANAVGVSAGDYHSLAAKADGTVLGWGYDAFGETQPPAGLSNVVATAAGNQFSVALKADRTLSGWGNDWNGQVDFPAALTNVVAIAAGDSHTVVLLGKPWAPPQMLRVGRLGGQFSLWVQTVAGKNYALESTSSLLPDGWSTVSWVRGNGAMQLFVDPSANAPYRFYRLRQW